MDQTMVRMDSPANRTNNVVGESTVRIANTGCARRGFTVALAACASGHKLPAFVFLKEPSGRIPPKALMSLCIPADVRVTASKNGWMTSDKLQEWLSRVWGPNSNDATKDALEQRDTVVVYVPAGCTSLLQPADVYWNRPFKANLRQPQGRTMLGSFAKEWELEHPELKRPEDCKTQGQEQRAGALNKVGRDGDERRRTVKQGQTARRKHSKTPEERSLPYGTIQRSKGRRIVTPARHTNVRHVFSRTVKGVWIRVHEHGAAGASRFIH
ncbi:hypothetical protein HPB50_002176 [Hyalomma asiaticum]|uniref:Uncharacterized protein n=1 Tax=Hyalomma asiaticum TaxID=266040 RepID=A0ACB7RII0_HYAAI|nr:hypothetical protein HPB50_002176 [Hyalomma asiaticum]